MAGYTKAIMITLQIFIVTTFIAFVLGGTVPAEKIVGGGPSSSAVAAVEKAGHDSSLINNRLELPAAAAVGAKMDTRAKRSPYIGWGRRPGLRYSKATSVFDSDNLFNKMYNRYEKRGQTGPEAPISNFRELRMKQKVPNVQLLLPHLFNRNNRVPPIGTSDLDGSDLGVLDLDNNNNSPRLSDDEIEALMLYLEDYMKNIRANEQ